ncbi:MAG: hypothetical protein KFF50_00620 [Desulfatitalea sp.]|jgi:hypothetical protein|nr:hypothetical protein [Desulfatitalea sp.]
MGQIIENTAWVYVVVQNPGQQENILGQRDDALDITFIPVFKDRDTAQQGVLHLVKQPGLSLEIQAIIFEDLTRYAVQGGFLLFLLDGTGQIVTKMSPDGQPL